MRTHTRTRTHGLEPVPIPINSLTCRTRTHTRTHGLVLVPVPVPMGLYPYPYPWVRTRTRTHTYTHSQVVPVPKATLYNINEQEDNYAFLVLHTISYIVLYMLCGKGGWKLEIEIWQNIFYGFLNTVHLTNFVLTWHKLTQ